MVAVNADRIEDIADPLADWKMKPSLIVSGVYAGGFANIRRLEALEKEYGVRRIVSLLNPKIPVWRELSAYERQWCESRGIELVFLPSGELRESSGTTAVIASLLADDPKPTYIHGYLDDRSAAVALRDHLHGAGQTLQMNDKEPGSSATH